MTNEELAKYYVRPVKDWDRLNSELKVVRENESGIDLINYFLVLADIISYARKQGIFVGLGRGSAAGSYLTYILGITGVNPLEHDLPFSRFLSNVRISNNSMPDIDTDLPTTKRQIILDYIFDKYKDKACHVAIFSSLKIKNALQDCFRALITQPSELEIDNCKKSGDLTKSNQLAIKLKQQTEEFNLIRKSLEALIPGATDTEILHGYTNSDGLYSPGLLETNKLFADWVKRNPVLFETTEKILGLPRHIGRHAGGILISPVSLPSIVPVFKDNNAPVIVYDKKISAKHGLIKYDLLGLTALDFVQDCVDLLKKDGINIDIFNLPDNPKMYDVFTDGYCFGLFQWSTSGGARFAKKLKPKSLDDICVGTALNRPGSLDAMIKISDTEEMSAADVYIKRKNKELPVEYLHKDLEPILKSTFGVFVYQEQVMEALQKLFGYSEQESDYVRSKISEKDVRSFEKVKQDAQVLLTKGWSQKQIDDIYQQILAFSRYSFCKAHAYSYGILSYLTAYLKSNYPLYWWAGVLTNSSEEEINKYWSEVYQFIGFPDINELSDRYKIKNGKLIPPISCIKGVGDAVIAEINKNGPYTTLEDFFVKTSRRIINVGVVQKLVITGALDSLFGREFHSPEAKLRYVFAILKKNDKDNLPEKFQNLNPYEWYLELKRTLPSSAASLYQAIKKTPEVKMPFITKDLGENVFGSALRGKYVLVNGKGLQNLINEMSGMGKSYVEVCAYGYVKSLRRFSYKGNTRSAIEVNIDFDFLPYSGVIWAPYDEKEPECNSYLLDKNAYLFTLRVKSEEGKEVQIMSVKKILMEKKEEAK